MIILDVETLRKLTNIVGLEAIMDKIITRLKFDFSNWNKFSKIPRVVNESKYGVIELMPTNSDDYYSFKYVNGHPNNINLGIPCVMALGLLATVKDGMPLLMSEMTILTAIRTACVSALATEYLANIDASILGVIGCGAQAEFQILAISRVRNIKQVFIYDIDKSTEIKLINNLKKYDLAINIANSIDEIVQNVDIVVTATAKRAEQSILTVDMLKPGLHINAIGGDSSGKTELDCNILAKSKVVVEYLPQSKVEGEIQHLSDHSDIVELHEVINSKKEIRTSESDITLFDSVGFAIEDYSTLRVIYNLLLEHNLAKESNLIPSLENPKDLFALLYEDTTL